jgi:hypothetical protein
MTPNHVQCAIVLAAISAVANLSCDSVGGNGLIGTGCDFFAGGCSPLEPTEPVIETPTANACAAFAAACYDEWPLGALNVVRFRPNGRWQTDEVTWNIISFHPDIPEADQLAQAARAFDAWSAVAALKFTRTDSPDANIKINFVDNPSGAPGACAAADGFLGRTFFPGTRNGGTVELCDDAPFSLDPDDGQIDLFTVLLHELGHAIGIEHSTEDGSIMGPAYLGPVAGPALTDARAAQRIYGSPDGSVTPDRVTLPGARLEQLYAFTDALDAEPDRDQDGVADALEVFLFNTNPDNPDTDNDGVDDFTELFIDGTPAAATGNDADADGLPDDDEAFYNADPNDPDTDGDTIPDGIEVAFYGTDPALADTDGDGLSDGEEVNGLGSDPNDADSDFDGLPDGIDPDPFDALDTDSDGLPDGFETRIVGTDPTREDSDGDGLDDFAEFLLLTTDPTNPDTDGDGVLDLEDIISDVLFGIEPTADDLDGDALRNIGEEVYIFTDPTHRDTDGDTVLDGAEDLVGTDPNNPGAINPPELIDSDADTLPDIIETDLIGSDPNQTDSDLDGLPDLEEVRP